MDPVSISVLVFVLASSASSAVSLAQQAKEAKAKHKALVAKLKISKNDPSTKNGEADMKEISKIDLNKSLSYSGQENEKHHGGFLKALKKLSKSSSSNSLKAKNKVSYDCDGNDDTLDGQYKDFYEAKFHDYHNDHIINETYLSGVIAAHV